MTILRRAGVVIATRLSGCTQCSPQATRLPRYHSSQGLTIHGIHRLSCSCCCSSYSQGDMDSFLLLCLCWGNWETTELHALPACSLIYGACLAPLGICFCNPNKSRPIYLAKAIFTQNSVHCYRPASWIWPEAMDLWECQLSNSWMSICRSYYDEEKNFLELRYSFRRFRTPWNCMRNLRWIRGFFFLEETVNNFH